MSKKRILVAVMNWGLGHATRSIPVINALQNEHYEPMVASDGAALQLLKKEFPELTHLELPGYNIQYAKKGWLLNWKIIAQTSHIRKTIAAEKEKTRQIIKDYQIEGIISDNRFGVYSDDLKTNVFITHQIHVLSGITTFLSTFINRKHLKNFDQIWIPDYASTERNLSGKLSHVDDLPEQCTYIGALSRFEKREIEIKYKHLLLLSGPEPQRSLLEEKLLACFSNTNDSILLVRGVISEEEQLSSTNSNLQIRNYLFGRELEEAINSSETIIARSGYTTLMDLAKLEKKAFFIPTPGQEEQEYLAKRLERLGIAPFCSQNQFNLEKLKNIDNYTGLSNFGDGRVLRDLFAFFESE